MEAKVSVVILAGGRSSRMGQDKASLSWGKGNILDSLLETAFKVSDDVIVATNLQRDLPCKVKQVADFIPDSGPLGGIHAGLVTAKYPFAFVAACDLPFLTTAIISHVIQYCNRYEAAVLVREEKIEPLIACYSKTCINKIEQFLAKGEKKVVKFLSTIQWVAVEDHSRSEDFYFMNVNNVNDYRLAKAILEKRS